MSDQPNCLATLDGGPFSGRVLAWHSAIPRLAVETLRAIHIYERVPGAALPGAEVLAYQGSAKRPATDGTSGAKTKAQP